MVRLGRVMMEEVIMKKLFVIACAFAAAIGCQKAEMEQPQENEGARVPLKITADIAQTKTTMTNDGGVLKSAWKNGDKIYVQRFWDTCYSQENVLECTAEVSGNVVTFSTEDMLKVPEVAANQYYRYTLLAEYPKALKSYATSRAFSMSSNQTQSAPGDLSHIADADLMYAWSSVNWAADPICAEFKFQHILSVLQLDLKADAEGVLLNKLEVEMLDETGSDYLVITDGQINLRDGSISQKSGSNKLTLSFPVPVELPTDEYAQFYMTISPGHAGQTFKVTATTDMGEVIEVGSMKVPDNGAIPQGAKALKKFTVRAPQKEEIDYSSAIDLSAAGTANTYIVNAPKTVYKFNAQVMGNGTVPTKMTEIVTSTVLAPKTALSLWYTCKQTSTDWVDAAPVEVSSIKLEDGYIYFKTPETFVNGNMVIAAFADEGLTYSSITVNENREFTNATILWSWDIWAVEGYNPETSKIDMEGYSVMDRNLGAIVGLSDADAASNLTNGVWIANAQGNYYEFGRKDPFPGFAEYPAYYPLNYGEKLLTTPAYTLITALQMNGIGTSKSLDNQMFGTIEASCTPLTTTLNYTDVELLGYVNGNPHKDINGDANPYNWQSGGLGNYWKDMWGGESDSAPSYKTIYDPCPAGWKLWDYNTMENFSIANEAAATTLTDDKQTCLGINVAGSLFPFNGGGRNYTFGLNGFGSLRNTQAGSAASIAFYSASPYYYHTEYNKNYLGSYSAVTDWKVTVTAEGGLSLVMTAIDEDNENRPYMKTTSAYTARAIPVRCIKE